MCVILELAEKFATELSQDDQMFRLVSAALDRLEIDEEADLLVLAFDVKILAINGLMPTLKRCARCGGRKEAASFSAAEGGIICAGCESGAIKTESGAIDLINNVLRVRFNQLDTIEASKRIIQIARLMIEEHIDYHGQAVLKARGYTKKE